MEQLLENNEIIIPITEGEVLEKGTVVRRVSKEKDQQGGFTSYDDKKGLILLNVIDLKNHSFAAETGIIHPTDEDSLYKYTTRFGDSPFSMEALDVIKNWPRYKKNPILQNAMINFVTHSYVPEQIIYLHKKEAMEYIYLPLQEKFKIGRFEEKINWEKVWQEKFKNNLDSLENEQHMTYLAIVPQKKSEHSKFYSVGSKPHEETDICLKSEPFNFLASHGGHIRFDGLRDKKRHYIVDAGSNYMGKGHKTVIKTAKEVTDALQKLYSDSEFTPVEGRDAFGDQQSF